MNEKIDILLATHNGEKFIKEQIDSIFAQTYNNFNLIISDDDSTDGTCKIIEEYVEKYSNIQFFKNKFKNSNENFGFLVEKSSEKYVAFCDQDDVWLPKKIEICYNKLIAENVALVYSDLYVVDKELNILSKFSESRSKISTPFSGEYCFRVANRNDAPGCTMLMKSEIAKQIVPMKKDDLIHDWKAFIVASKNGGILYINEPLIYYRQHDNNQIGANKKRSAEMVVSEIKTSVNKISIFIGKDDIMYKALQSSKKPISLSPYTFLLITRSNYTLYGKLNYILYYNLNCLYLPIAKVFSSIK